MKFDHLPLPRADPPEGRGEHSKGSQPVERDLVTCCEPLPPPAFPPERGPLDFLQKVTLLIAARSRGFFVTMLVTMDATIIVTVLLTVLVTVHVTIIVTVLVTGVELLGQLRNPRVARHQGSLQHLQVSGFRVQGSGFKVQGSGCRVQGSECRMQGSGCSGGATKVASNICILSRVSD